MNSDDADNLREFARSGDEHAFRRIVEAHAPMVYGVAWRRTHDRSLAEDVTQTVFAILARKAAAITHSELAGWLHRAAFIETRNATRKEARRQQALSELTATMSAEDPTHAAEWQDVSPHLDELMGRLPAEDRQLVVMRFFQQLSYREISRTTGRTEEASRKQMQRALDKLGSLLRRRGVATTGSTLAVVLTAQTLCTPPASAVLIAAAALKAAPAVTGAASLTHSLYLMTTQTIVKTSAVALLVAAAPVALLWHQNQDLKQQITQLQTRPASIATSGEVAETARTTSVNLPASDARPERAKRPAQTAAKEKEPSAMDAISTFFKGDNLLTIVEGQAKVESARQLNRLNTRLGLNESQKTALSGFFDRKNEAMKTSMEKLKDSGMLDRAMKGGGEISDEDKAQLATIAAPMESTSNLDAFLDGILTPEQKETQTKVKEEERSEAARVSAQSAIDDVAKHIDLSADQKDRLFDAIAAKQLAAPEKPSAEEFNPQTLLASSDKDESNGNDEVIRTILTPEQMEAYTKSRDEENAQTQELFKSLMPGLMKDGDK